MGVTVQLLLNLAFLIILMFIYEVSYRRIYAKHSKTVIFIYFSIAILSSLFLSVYVSENVRFDLRQVPLIIAVLYLGKETGILLFLVSIIMRGVFGINDGFWIFIIVFGIQTLLLVLLQPIFNKQTLKIKVSIAVLISLLSSAGLVISTLFLDHPLSFMEWMLFITVSAFGVGAIVVLIESEKIIGMIKQKVEDTEKLVTVSQMSASISHEVRNPLTTVKGFLQLLKEPDFSQEKREIFIDLSLRELERAEMIITNYLNYAKPDVHTREKISLEQELTYLLTIIQPFANNSSVEIISRFQEDGWIIGDRHHLHQCFINLFKNSIEAMPQGGEITIHLYQKEGDGIICFSDTGSGMTEEQQQNLGKAYFSTKGEKGTGLGTMVAFDVIRSLRGKIHIDSKLGEGTTFTVSFPLWKQESLLGNEQETLL